jgi:hypothetical protein
MRSVGSETVAEVERGSNPPQFGAMEFPLDPGNRFVGWAKVHVTPRFLLVCVFFALQISVCQVMPVPAAIVAAAEEARQSRHVDHSILGIVLAVGVVVTRTLTGKQILPKPPGRSVPILLVNNEVRE